jgi:hypothetical protein
VKSFIQTLAGVVFGVLSGFDRLMFRGHLRELAFAGGMNRYGNFNGVPLTDFAKHAEQLTGRLIGASEAEAKRLDRPIEYLPSPKLRKEDHARELARRDGITQGLIGVFLCVEPCWSFALRGNRASKKLEFRPELRKCLHLYHYDQHPLFGLCYGRVQTWFPFTIQIGLNGREWLTRQRDGASLRYRRHDNCITRGGTPTAFGVGESAVAVAARAWFAEESAENASLPGDGSRPTAPHRTQGRPPRLDAKARGASRLEFFARREESEC